MVWSQRIRSTSQNVFKERQRFLMTTETVEVERLKSLRRQCARVVGSMTEPDARREVRPERDRLFVAT
jgi:hypothetical protein